MAKCIELCCTHDINQWIVVRVDGEVWELVQIVMQFLTHSPFKCEELNASFPLFRW